MTYYVYLPFPKEGITDDASKPLTVNDTAYRGRADKSMVFPRSNLSPSGDAAGLEIDGGKTVWLHDKGHFRDKMGKSRFGRLRKANRVLSVGRPEDVLVINGHGSDV